MSKSAVQSPSSLLPKCNTSHRLNLPIGESMPLMAMWSSAAPVNEVDIILYYNEASIKCSISILPLNIQVML